MYKARDDIKAVYSAAIAAANPSAAVKNHLKLEGGKLRLYSLGKMIREYALKDFRNIFILGSGKATASMAKAVEEILGDKITAGLISVKYGYTESLSSIETIEASHPVPDEHGREAAVRIREMAGKASRDDLIISLISGGGSALLPLPAPPITLDEKRAATDLLLRCGASIHEINAVRKHLSMVKGGNLARAAYPATIINLMISDVVGDDTDVIASGPFTADNSTFSSALDILNKYGLTGKVPRPVLDRLQEGAGGNIEENPKNGSPVFEKVSGVIVASNLLALMAAREEAERRGYHSIILSSLFEGETRDAAAFHCAVAREVQASGNPVPPPACLISGGETTVTVRGNGLGGRNMEFSLHSAVYLRGLHAVSMASVGTDGTDGPTDAAGACADGTTAERSEALRLDIARYIGNNDSYNFFKELGDLIITGPTNTNVMDVRIFIILK